MASRTPGWLAFLDEEICPPSLQRYADSRRDPPPTNIGNALQPAFDQSTCQRETVAGRHTSYDRSPWTMLEPAASTPHQAGCPLGQCVRKIRARKGNVAEQCVTAGGEELEGIADESLSLHFARNVVQDGVRQNPIERSEIAEIVAGYVCAADYGGGKKFRENDDSLGRYIHSRIARGTSGNWHAQYPSAAADVNHGHAIRRELCDDILHHPAHLRRCRAGGPRAGDHWIVAPSDAIVKGADWVV